MRDTSRWRSCTQYCVTLETNLDGPRVKHSIVATDMIISLLESTWLTGLSGSLAFTGMLLVHHFFGPGPDVRDERGKKVIPKEYRTFVIVEMVIVVSVLLFAATRGILEFREAVGESSIYTQLAAGYLVLWIINLWDLIVIDWALVVRFRPRWLDVPDTPYFNTMKPHVQGWLAGHLYMIPVAGIAYFISRQF